MDEEIRERRIRRRHRTRRGRLTPDLLDRVNDPNDLLEPEPEGQASPVPHSTLEKEDVEDEARFLDE